MTLAFSACCKGSSVISKQQERRNDMDKDLITLDLDTPLPFRLSGATPSQQVYISLRHMDDKRKLEPVHLCKKHRREDEDDGCKNKFLFQMNHPVCDHKIVDSHPTVAFPVKDLGPDKTMDFALTMLCLSSCHSKGKAKDKKGMELVLCLRETFPENKLVKEERFILHVYANWIRDHPKAVKRSQDNAASGAATTKLPRRAKEVETTKLVPATLSQASRVQDQWCFTEHQELRSEITASLAVKHDCLQDNKTATLVMEAGESVGLKTGVSLGVEPGVSLGVEAGESLGLETGVSLGVEAGESLGLETGVSLGVEAGESLGLETGVSLGVEAGESLGLETGVSLGVEAGGSVKGNVGGSLGIEGVWNEGRGSGGNAGRVEGRKPEKETEKIRGGKTEKKKILVENGRAQQTPSSLPQDLMLRDEYSVFGEHIANQLRYMNKKNYFIAQRKMINIICKLNTKSQSSSSSSHIHL